MNAEKPKKIVVVTGSRAEYGLLRPVMRAIRQQPACELLVIAAGSHLVGPQLTYRDVKADFEIIDKVPMQVAGRTGRLADCEATGTGIARFARVFGFHAPDWIVVLGDRIEAFAAGAAASIGGFALAHIHGGDRAEGVADEAMRHALTKMAHLHFAATVASAERITRMGERPDRVHTVGSPAIDDLASFPALGDQEFAELGSPDRVVLMHPVGREAEAEERCAASALEALEGNRLLVLHPNFDPGRDGIVRAITTSGAPFRLHLERRVFVGLLRRLAAARGVLVGNSSAALIEAAALGLPAVDIGSRQAGRETPPNVVHAEDESTDAIRRAVSRAASIDRSGLSHPYGDGRSGERIARTLASLDSRSPGFVKKHNTY